MSDVRKVTLEEWRAEAERLFGKDPMKWRFKCVSCGHVQCGEDFKGIVDKPMDHVFYDCIGRYKEGVGCDWTLGGLLGIHKLEVDPGGSLDPIPSFEFAEEQGA